ncbi:MAG: sigma-70 family RNA polymerase sigma factor [Clostridia bacterium]|nr:sigma-70 family RNA polymerase sigma factor [Clostridia bacterium]
MLLYKDEEFIKNNFGLVHSCCKRFVGRGIEYDDLFQTGCMGLIKAAKDFDESRGFMFSTYAVPVILGEIKRVFRDTGAIKVSRSLKELSLKVTAQKEKFEKQNGYNPTVEQLAKILGVTATEISDAISASAPPLSLTYSDEDGTNEYDFPSPDNTDNLFNKIYVSEILASLPETERKIIILRHFSGLTQSQVAKKLGMSQVQISRKEKKLLEKLRTNSI